MATVRKKVLANVKSYTKAYTKDDQVHQVKIRDIYETASELMHGNAQ